MNTTSAEPQVCSVSLVGHVVILSSLIWNAGGVMVTPEMHDVGSNGQYGYKYVFIDVDCSFVGAWKNGQTA